MKILFASDMSFNYLPTFPGKEAAKAAMYKTSEYFRRADFSVVNLENILGVKGDYTPIPKDGPNLMSTEDFIEYIDVLSPTAVGLANNHTKDFGPEPMFRTMDLLRRHGYAVFGAGENIKEAYKPAIFEKDGTRVAIIGVCENEFGVADENVSGTAGYSLSRVKGAIRSARADGMLPIIYFHGGNEGNPFPSPGKVEMYRNFVDMGAAAVIAMHTHCPQGYEIYDGAPIVYSMGNFFFPVLKSYAPSWSAGYMSMLNISKDGSITLEVIPYKFGETEHTVLDGEELEYMHGYLDYITAPIKSEEEIRKRFDSWCLAKMGANGEDGYIKTVSDFNSKVLKADTPEGLRPMSLLKNIFSCEAHSELLTNYLNLFYNGKIDEALKGCDEISSLQRLKYKEA